MNIASKTPGPDAAHAFRLGLRAGAIFGVALIGTLYWFGIIEPLLAGYALLLLFPVYLVFVAAALSVWLGYNKDATALRPVYKRN
jgi:hypothetical protein